jgi:hypothetical protein
MLNCLPKKKQKEGKTLTEEGIHNPLTKASPLPSCPVAIKTFDRSGTKPITGFPSGTETDESFLSVNIKRDCKANNITFYIPALL